MTGSTRGIGAAIADRLARSGDRVIRHGSSGESTGDYHAADLSTPEGRRDLADRVRREGLDVLVNNAGVYVPAPFGADDEAWARQFAINVEAPRALMASFAEGRTGGKILNVASRVGFRGEPGASAYAATKAALINLTRSLAVEWADRRIGVFAIAPGWVETAMARDGMDDRLTEILKTLPLGRMASPEDCAAAAEFLLSDGASYLSGQAIDINGASYFH